MNESIVKKERKNKNEAFTTRRVECNHTLNPHNLNPKCEDNVNFH
jgi:hypothetical protein